MSVYLFLTGITMHEEGGGRVRIIDPIAGTGFHGALFEQADYYAVTITIIITITLTKPLLLLLLLLLCTTNYYVLLLLLLLLLLCTMYYVLCTMYYVQCIITTSIITTSIIATMILRAGGRRGHERGLGPTLLLRMLDIELEGPEPPSAVMVVVVFAVVEVTGGSTQTSGSDTQYLTHCAASRSLYIYIYMYIVDTIYIYIYIYIHI